MPSFATVAALFVSVGLNNMMRLVLAGSAPTRALAKFRTAFVSPEYNTRSSSRLFSKKEWTTDQVRSTFVDFFADKDHTRQPSSACAPLNDPTLLFTNAGMNQFKPIFLGQTDPSSPLASLKRAANSQKCIRAGGKHNDLEDVGRDTYHHTFFEMLGSWSFGDYFKKEAIAYAWELLTEIYQMDPERMYATYFQGSDELEPDYEARDIWLQYLPPERVIGCDAKDNFWEMGETGPCGPCSEIHYDRVGDRDAASLVNADDPDVIEIWNIVFIQYNRDPSSSLAELPQKHIDTGMGLERLASILQEKSSNYDIDVFQPIFDKISEHSNVGKYTGLVLEDDKTLKDTAYRAIADHARTLAFAIADGAVPNNEGRGYVLRRVLRRATRYGQQILNADPGFFSTLVPVVVETFGEAYPELVENQDTIQEIIQEEETAFSVMLERGIKFFTDLASELKGAKETTVSGDKAFFLYDTLGFPIDLTELMAEEAGLKLDMNGFNKEMEAQKQRSREARNSAKSGGGPRLELMAEQTSWLADNGVAVTDDNYKYEWKSQIEATVKAVFGPHGFSKEGSTLPAGESVGLILDKSSFYAEAGGQEADTGTIKIVSDDGTVTGIFVVTDVQAYGGFLLHSGVVQEGDIKVGVPVTCHVDYERRKLIAPNHSMTHVLNAALREVLGDGVEQRGSLCNEEKLRFDFSHKKAMTAKQLRDTERFCQAVVTEAEQVSSEVMPLSVAREIDGVRAVKGEVYPSTVRVVSVGSDTSVEFCGGTHVSNTAEVQDFVIVEETSVAKGIRRITAVTGEAASKAIHEGSKIEQAVAEIETMSADKTGLDKEAGALRKDLDAAFLSAPLKAELRGRIEAIQKKAMDVKKAALAGRISQSVEKVREDLSSAVSQGKRAIVLNIDIGADSKASQKIMKAAGTVAPEVAFMGLSEEDEGCGGKLLAFAVVPGSLIKDGFKADDWIRQTLEVCGGRGGGRPGNAQGQAKECSDVDEVIAAANAFAESKLGAAAL